MMDPYTRDNELLFGTDCSEGYDMYTYNLLDLPPEYKENLFIIQLYAESDIGIRHDDIFVILPDMEITF